MLVNGPKVHRFKPGRGWIFKGDKIHGMTSFRGEVKLLVPCCKILRHIKESYKYEKR
jgi:hypothetical protein